MEIKDIWYYFDGFWSEIEDKRLTNWLLIDGGVWKVLAIMYAYLYLTRVILSGIMQNRTSFELKLILIVYNIIMIYVNAILFFNIINLIHWGKVFLNFDYPSLSETSRETTRLLLLSWYFLMSRYLDLASSIFFVLRHKETRMPFMHFYNRVVVTLFVWVCLKYNGLMPILSLFVSINTAIQTLWYSYYLLVLIGLSKNAFLWWKEYVVHLQRLQFAICLVYGVLLYFKQTNYPNELFQFFAVLNPIFMYMCYDFYYNSYKVNLEWKPKTA